VNRRSILQALLGLSATQLLPGQSASPVTNARLPLTAADAIAQGLSRFLSPAEFADFRQLGALLMPAFEGRPGAVEAEAPEFLDFLLGQSPADMQAIYRDGVRRLGAAAKDRYKKPFAQVNADEAGTLLSPLKEPWNYEEPKDPYARFLKAAKIAFYQATVNSRQWAASSRSRAGAGVGTYWLPIE
jgi:hypothetical protein